MPARESSALVLWFVLLALAAAGCAKSRRDDAQVSPDASASTADAGSATEARDGSTERGRDAAADSGVVTSGLDAGTPSSPAQPDAATVPQRSYDAGAPMEHTPPDEDGGEPFKPSYCRGTDNFNVRPKYEHIDCCEGFHEIEIPDRGFDAHENPICGPDSQLVGCIRGACGDGVCELAEAEPCSCPADCPSAVWETLPKPVWTNGLSGTPSSCSQQDIIAKLKVEGDVTDCGDLALDVALADRQKATTCARNAYAMNQPFQVFWRVNDGTNTYRMGIYATRRADGTLVSYQLAVDAMNTPTGATAVWDQCTLPSDEECAANFDRCLDCGIVDQAAPLCYCFPEVVRSDGPAGAMLQVECMTAEEWTKPDAR